MSEILLATLNAKYVHSALGVRYLRANLGDLRSRSALIEADINQRPLDVAERLLSHNPRIIGLGVYIWNVAQCAELAVIFKRLRPDIILVLGGPEVSFETESHPIVRLADYVITGEADLEFGNLCGALLAGDKPKANVRAASPPDLAKLALPYDEYDDRDVAERWLYVEVTRGCPFRCEFCLSSLGGATRPFPLQPILAALDRLLGRGARRFKFVDRTFNIDLETCHAVLDFFLDRLVPGLILHFEMIPDRLPESLRDRIRRFAPGVLRIEVGIQTFNGEVAERICRRQHYPAVEENLRFLRRHTSAHLHADLIVGLPGEDLASVAASFDRLVELSPHEIQVGILKRLRGTSIGRHDAQWGMVYSPLAPYEILKHSQIDFATMQRLRRFAHYWELIGNSGNFVETAPLLWSGGESPFGAFLGFSDWLYEVAGCRHGISLPRLAEFLFDYLREVLGHPPSKVAQCLARDYIRPGRREPPPFLRPHLPHPAS